MRLCILATMVFAVCVGGCIRPGDNSNSNENSNSNSNDNSSPTDKETGSAKLLQFESEDDFRQYAADMLNEGFEIRFGGENAGGSDDKAPNATPEASDGDASLYDEASSSDSAGFSDTTTQVEGVQEADIIKNDGTYLYFLSKGTLRIVQANPADSMQELANIELDGYAYDLYKLPNDADVATKLVAITHEDNWAWEDEEGPDKFEYGMTLLEILTHVVVIDVTDHANPVIESKATFGGHSGQSRMIGSTLYLVQSITPDFYLMVDAFTGEVQPEDIDPDKLIPDYSIEVDGTVVKEGKLVDVEDIYRPEDPDGFGMTAIVSLDVDDPASMTSTGLFATPGNLYASTEAIYMTDTAWNFFTGHTRDTTDIYKFAITDNGAEFAAVGSIEGRVLNQYSMGEHDGYLRIATTTFPTWGWWGPVDVDVMVDIEEVSNDSSEATSETGSGEATSEPRTDSDEAEEPENEIPTTTNTVYVLGDNDADGELEVAGSISDIAPGEQIYSARFIGDRGFLVTFEQIDPLFTLDLSDPANPTTVGELKVPGYSTYITTMGENHLLTIGQDVDSSGEWPVIGGVQLSIFDITDFANPTLLHKEVLGSWDTWSEAVNNPKAFNYYPALNMIAIPVHYEDWGYDDTWFVDEDGDEEIDTNGDDDVNTNGDDPSEPMKPDEDPYWPTEPEEYFHGIYVFEATPENGFVKKGEISLIEYDSTSWWNYPSFTRGIFMGENVYGVSDVTIKAAPVTDVNSAPWSLSIEQEEPDWDTDGAVEPPAEPRPLL